LQDVTTDLKASVKKEVAGDINAGNRKKSRSQCREDKFRLKLTHPK
jgi:hypothetical protein